MTSDKDALPTERPPVHFNLLFIRFISEEKQLLYNSLLLMTIADMKAALKWQIGGITCGDGFHWSGNWHEIGGNALIMHVSF